MAETLAKLNETFSVDRVITPFGKYVVVSYADKKYNGKGINFGGDFVFSTAPESTEKSIQGINRLAVERPQIIIQEQKEIASKLDLPYGSIEELLRQESMEHAAQIFQRRQIEYAEEIEKRWKNTKHQVPTLEECRKIIQTEFPLSIRDQLIKRTAHNYLNWKHTRPPFTLTSDREERGFVIIDNGVLSNCGYGIGEASFYKILSVESEQENSDTSFSKQTLEIEEILSSHIQPIPPSALNVQKMKELKQRGIVVNYDGWLAFLPITDKQKEQLVRANAHLITN